MPLELKLSNLDCTVIWKYDFPQNTGGKCQICRRSIMAPSYEDINNRNLVSKITIGKCGHAFHSECINNYCKKNVSCPIDFTQWEKCKEIEGPTSISIKPNSSIDHIKKPEDKNCVNKNKIDSLMDFKNPPLNTLPQMKHFKET